MANKYKSRKGRDKIYERIFYVLLALAAVALIALVVINLLPPAASEYTVTAEGMVLDADGVYLGDVYTLLMSGVLVMDTEGNIYDQHGHFVCDYTVLNNLLTTPADDTTVTDPEEPAAEEPAPEEPAAEEPAAEEPAVEEPAAEEPAAE